MKEQVQQLVDEINRTNRYSMSRIYGLHNQLFGIDETPQACASCLIRKKKDLEMWLEDETYIPPYLRHIDKIK